MQEKNLKYELQQLAVEEKIYQKQQQIIQSSLYHQYKKIVNVSQTSEYQLEQRLAAVGINYNRYGQKSDFHFKVRNFTQDDEVVGLTVELGNYNLELLVLNVFQTCSLQFGKPLGVGNFGSVYSLSRNGEEFTIKVFYLKNIQYQNMRFFSIVKELSIMKICSAFGLCPSMKRYLGFDMILFDDLAFFAMQKGIKVKKVNKDGIIQLLNTMHSLNIIHFDIKPQNLIFSPTQGKIVFIDFGFSDVIAEKRGYKTSTTFKGTPQFCSEQMVSILTCSKKSYIDLYYNDLHALRQSIKQMIQQNTHQFSQVSSSEYEFIADQGNQVNHSQQNSENLKLQKQILIFIFKASLLKEQYTTAKSVLNHSSQYLLKTKAEIIKKFFKKVPFSSEEYLTYFKEEIQYLQNLTQSDSIKKDSYNFVLQLLQNNINQKQYSGQMNTVKQSDHINLVDFNKYKGQSEKHLFNNLQYQQLLRKQSFTSFTYQYLLSLLQHLRVDKRSLIEFNKKIELAYIFLFQILPKGTCESQREIMQKSKRYPLLPFYLVFDEVRKYFENQKECHEDSILFEVFYQMLIVYQDDNSLLREIIAHFLERKFKKDQKLDLLISCLIWVKKYLQILEVKLKLTHKSNQLNLMQYLYEFIEEKMKFIEQMDNSKLSKEQRCFQRIILTLISVQKNCTVLYGPEIISQIIKDINYLPNSEISVYLSFELYNYFAEHEADNYCFSNFTQMYYKLTQILIKQYNKNSNNYFHLLIIHFAKTSLNLNHYSQFHGYQKQIKQLLQSNGIDSIFRMSYSSLFTVSQGKIGKFSFINLYQNLRDHFFENNLSKFIFYQFKLIISIIKFRIIERHFDNQYYSSLIGLQQIVERYYAFENNKQKLNTPNLLSIDQKEEIIGKLSFISLKFKGISRLIENRIQQLNQRLGYPIFTEQTIEEINQKEWNMQQLYLQLLISKIHNANISNKNSTVLFEYKAIIMIYQRKQWIGRLLISLNNLILVFSKIQHTISPPQCQELYTICVKKKAASFLFIEKSLILFFIMKISSLWAKDKVAQILEYVLKELEICCSILQVFTFIQNLQCLFSGNSDFFQSKNILSITNSIKGYCRYKVILFTFCIKRSLVLRIKDDYINKIQYEIQKVISQTRPLIRNFILAYQYLYITQLAGEPKRRVNWLKIKKGVLFFYKHQIRLFFRGEYLSNSALIGKKKRQLQKKLYRLSECYEDKKQADLIRLKQWPIMKQI